ncbi:MAG: MFS transporter, partial [Anaerolineales bacterium]|nr:MFS transporter [Anaerolineales bacterium]
MTIFLIVMIDLLGFGLILPLLPFYAETYAATPLLVGLLTASYAAAQLIGAPLLGRLSDRYGRRPVLLVSIFGTLLGFLLLGVADPLGRALAAGAGPDVTNTVILTLLFISRVVDGLTGGNLTVAQAY